MVGTDKCIKESDIGSRVSMNMNKIDEKFHHQEVYDGQNIKYLLYKMLITQEEFIACEIYFFNNERFIINECTENDVTVLQLWHNMPLTIILMATLPVSEREW